MVGFVQNTNKTHTMAEQELTCFYAEKYEKSLYDEKAS